MLHVVVMPIISQVLGEVLKDRNLILKVFNRLYETGWPFGYRRAASLLATAMAEYKPTAAAG